MARLLVNYLYGVTPNDPFSLMLATVVLLSVALAASFVPARRASRIDLISALNQG